MHPICKGRHFFMQLKQPNTRTWMTVKVMTKMVSQTAMGMTHRARCGAGNEGQGRQAEA